MAPTVDIMPMTTALLDAEDQGLAAFCKALGCPCPAAWPPEFHGPETRARMRRMLAVPPRDAAFVGYYIRAGGVPAGTCGFKGPPDADGRVDIGYSVILPERRKGLATAAVRQLLAAALADPRVQCVVAETLPALIASRRTAETCGFILTSRRPDDDLGEILTYTVRRPA